MFLTTLTQGTSSLRRKENSKKKGSHKRREDSYKNTSLKKRKLLALVEEKSLIREVV